MQQPHSLGLAPSFGFGDRIGTATPGHVEAMRRAGAGILPIFAQQSIREMARTARMPRQVMDDARHGMQAAGWDGPCGADADHLKSPRDVDVTMDAGFTFFTIDPSDHVDQQADDYDEPTLRAKFEAVRNESPWFAEYRGCSVLLATGTTIDLDESACLRAAVKYGRAINAAVALSNHIRTRSEESGRPYETELSVDETAQPTTLADHYIIADQCLRRGMKLVSLAPRFIGEFEKGVDYKGDVAALERSLADHAAIAGLLGPYQLSLHSGSDKLSMYPALARADQGAIPRQDRRHELSGSMRIIARHDEPLFRRIIAFARDRYEADKATYHVSATLDSAPPPDEIAGVAELERLYLECWDDVPAGKGFTAPGRQILHCTFGSVLTDGELGPAVHRVLDAHPDTYTEVLADHFTRHLQALRAGM